MADGQETGHWYDKDGNSQYTIVGANGKERNTTLRDAREGRLCAFRYNRNECCG